MKHILNPNIALRAWWFVPHAYYRRDVFGAKGLSAKDFDILKQCDGEAEIESSPLLESLVERGLCTLAKSGEKLTEWQKYRFCDNRYFPAVNWAITGKCNFNCRHCFNAADYSPLMSEFSWEQCQDFIRQLDECGVQNFSLTGGEPMLHPRFMDICREIVRYGMTIDELTTNGSFITPEMLDEFNSLGVNPVFKLSFDGIGHHDWFRDKKGAELQVIEKIKLLREKSFLVRMQTNVHKGNVDTILPTAKLAEELGVESIRIIRTTEAPRWAEMGGDLCLSVTEYYDFALEFISGFLVGNRQISVDIWQVFQIWPHSRRYHHRPVQSSAEKYRGSLPACCGTRGRIAVTPEGDILPCNQMSGYFKKHGIHMGNVHKTPLRELLTTGEYLDKVCYTVGELKEKNPKCQECPHWERCMGGCRGIGLLFGGSYDSYDPAKCIYFNDYYDKFDELFDDTWRCSD